MNENRFIKILNALGDRTRFKILKIIVKKEEISCLEITKKVNMSQPTISHHLKILTDSGIVRVRRSGKFGYFSINEKVLNAFQQDITKFLKQGGKLWKNG